MFSLELSEEQIELQKWVHGFAADVIRPAAHEWDEREETPWPIMQEAAKIGLYGFETLASLSADETGLSVPIFNEELFWGDGGIALAIMGSGLTAAGIFSAGTPEQMGEWIPQCYGTPDDPKVGAFCSSEPEAGSDVSAMRTRAVYNEATDEWVQWTESVGHQRRYRERLPGPGRGGQGAGLARSGGIHGVGRDKGAGGRQEAEEARIAGFQHGRRVPR